MSSENIVDHEDDAPMPHAAPDESAPATAESSVSLTGLQDQVNAQGVTLDEIRYAVHRNDETNRNLLALMNQVLDANNARAPQPNPALAPAPVTAAPVIQDPSSSAQGAAALAASIPAPAPEPAAAFQSEI